MKTALITTTVNVPHVLELYRMFGTGVIFIVGDEKTSLEAYTFCGGIPGCEIYSPERQRELGYEHSDLIGWNTDSRRNIALLEALKWGAELIVSIDDDMVPIGGEWNFSDRFELLFDGLQLGERGRWFDAGQFTIPKAPQRGLPCDYKPVGTPSFVTNAKIGAAQGIILAIPDTDACTAIAASPFVHSASDILKNGFVVHPEANAVFNSQFTAFRRELAPAFAQFYKHQQRNTDILASVLMRRIMRDRGLYTYFGPPMGFHARQPRPLFKDLKAEMFGLEHIAPFTEHLNRAPTQQHSIVDDCRDLVFGYSGFSDHTAAYAAWYNDVEKVL
jgi:hypothetical protein